MTKDGRKVAIVTGAAGEICGATAKCLERGGYRLVLTDRDPELERMKGDYAAGTEVLIGDITETGFADRLAKFAIEKAGRIDALVNGAGTSASRSILEQTEEEWDRLVAINLSPAFKIARACGKVMVEQGFGGAIVNISSVAHISGGANPAYGASKAGLVALTYKLAQDLGPHGIRANAVAPGVIATKMVHRAFPGAAYDRLSEAISSRTPLRRLGKAEDVAEVIAFLISDAAAFITGAVIPITGGLELLPPLGNFIGGTK